MAEYIEREALLNRIRDVYCADCNSYNGVRCRACGIGDTIDMIEDAPTVDAVPVRHGKWVNAPLCGNDYCRCSNCGSWHNIHANLRGEINFKYCPNCGARMEDDDND